MKRSMRTDRRRASALLLTAALVAGCSANPEPAAPPGAASEPAPAAPNQPARERSFAVTVSGQGKPMILIPGLASSGETWTTTVAHLGDRYQCHVLTLAGFAGVPPLAATEQPLVRVREDVASYIAEQGLGAPVVVGHSLGGYVALDLAAKHPDRVGALVIVDSMPFLGGVALQVETAEQAKPKLDGMRAFISGQTQAQYEAYTKSGMASRYMVTAAADLEKVIGWGMASDRTMVAAAILELLGTDLRPELARIASPALVLGTWTGWRDQNSAGVGGGGPTARADFVQAFQKQYAGLRQMRFAMTDSARHFIMFDDPRWFFAQLDRFLADPAAAVRDRGFAE
jgi:N-formylmaleamate deformylase